MPPTVALILTLLFIGFLFTRDHKGGYTPSLELLLPCIWVFIRGSRSVTEWLDLGTPPTGVDIVEGTPADRAVTFLLMSAGLVVLLRRPIAWASILKSNAFLILFLFYCAVSICWSDFPLVAFKRWVKLFGDPIMALIILTDRDPLRAVEIVFRSMANLLVPLSVLFIKYYPQLGRGYSEWTGTAWYTGVTTNKNLLGFVLMVSGLSLVWRLQKRWGDAVSKNKVDTVVIPLVLLLMVAWLFSMANSKTSFIGFLIGVAVFFVLGLSPVRRNISVYLVIGVLLFVVLQSTMNITDLIITSAGRDATLTGRTELWEVVLKMQRHPILGFGFESFWLGDRLSALQDMWFFKPTQAHSGYIELYLNLGWIGWVFFSGVIFACFLKLRKLLMLRSDQSEWVCFGRLGMAYLFVYLVYNYTEAAFKSPHLLFLIFLLFGMTDLTRQVRSRVASTGLSRDTRSIRVAGNSLAAPIH